MKKEIQDIFDTVENVIKAGIKTAAMKEEKPQLHCYHVCTRECIENVCGCLCGDDHYDTERDAYDDRLYLLEPEDFSGATLGEER